MFKFLNRSEKIEKTGLNEADQIRVAELKNQLQEAKFQLAAFPNSASMSRKVLLLTNEIKKVEGEDKNGNI